MQYHRPPKYSCSNCTKNIFYIPLYKDKLQTTKYLCSNIVLNIFIHLPHSLKLNTGSRFVRNYNLNTYKYKHSYKENVHIILKLFTFDNFQFRC